MPFSLSLSISLSLSPPPPPPSPSSLLSPSLLFLALFWCLCYLSFYLWSVVLPTCVFHLAHFYQELIKRTIYRLLLPSSRLFQSCYYYFSFPRNISQFLENRNPSSLNPLNPPPWLILGIFILDSFPNDFVANQTWNRFRNWRRCIEIDSSSVFLFSIRFFAHRWNVGGLSGTRIDSDFELIQCYTFLSNGRCFKLRHSYWLSRQSAFIIVKPITINSCV